MEEPVSLSFLKAYLQMDADDSTQDEVLTLLLGTARELIEGYTNIGLVYRQIKVQWDGCKLQLPYSPTGSIISVTKNGEAFEDYYVDTYQAKTIYGFLKSIMTADYFYSIANGTVEISNVQGASNDDVYEVTYNTGYEVLPNSLKYALCEQVAYMKDNRGNAGLSTKALAFAEKYSRNLVL